MHPLTVYEIAMLEHQQATDQRLRDHLVALRRRARLTVTPAPRHPDAPAADADDVAPPGQRPPDQRPVCHDGAMVCAAPGRP